MKEVNAIGHTQDHASARTLIVLLLILFVGCDPGLTVRQINSSVESEGATVTAIPKISIDVKTTQLLIGQTVYDPPVIATNSSDVPVMITRVELIAGGRTFRNGPYTEKEYPVNLPVHSAVPVGVYFRLSDGVAKIFENPGELLIHYSSQPGAGFVRIRVARGPLNAK